MGSSGRSARAVTSEDSFSTASLLRALRQSGGWVGVPASAGLRRADGRLGASLYESSLESRLQPVFGVPTVGSVRSLYESSLESRLQPVFGVPTVGSVRSLYESSLESRLQPVFGVPTVGSVRSLYESSLESRL